MFLPSEGYPEPYIAMLSFKLCKTRILRLKDLSYTKINFIVTYWSRLKEAKGSTTTDLVVNGMLLMWQIRTVERK